MRSEIEPAASASRRRRQLLALAADAAVRSRLIDPDGARRKRARIVRSAPTHPLSQFFVESNIRVKRAVITDINEEAR